MGNPRNGGNKDYNFDYFERMNQKKKPSKPSNPAKPPAPSGKRRAQPPPTNSRQQRQEAAERNRKAARQAEKNPAPGKAKRRPPAGASPPKPGKKSLPPKPQKPKKPPKPKKQKPSLSPEQRKKRRRRNWILFYISLFLTVVTAGVVLSLTVLFHVNEIMVTGESRYTQEEILQVSQLRTGGNLFLTDTGTATQRIQDSLPYVGSVKISRKLPSMLVIQVEDVVVAGAVRNGSGYLVVGANGKALEQVPYLPEGCASIVGAKLSQGTVGKMVEYADKSQTDLIQKLTMAADENELDSITQIDISDPYNVKMVYDGRITLEFGLPTDLEYKVRFAQSVLSTGRISATETGVLDLSLAREMSKAYFDPDYTISASSASAVSSEPVSEPSSAISEVTSEPAG